MNYRSKIAGALVAAIALAAAAGCDTNGQASPGQPTSAPTSTSARELLSGPLTTNGLPGPDQGCQPPATIEVLAVANYVTSRDDEGDRQGFDHGLFQLEVPLCGTKMLFVELGKEFVETGFYKVGDCVSLKLRDLQVAEQEVMGLLDGQGIAHATGCTLQPVTATVKKVHLFGDGTIDALSVTLKGGVTADGERDIMLDPDGFAVRECEIRVGAQLSFYPFERDFSIDESGELVEPGTVNFWMQLDEHWKQERLRVLYPGPSSAPSPTPSQESTPVVHGDDGPLDSDEDESESC